MSGSPQARGPFDGVMQSQAVSNAVQSHGDPYMDARRRMAMMGVAGGNPPPRPFGGMSMLQQMGGYNPDQATDVFTKYG